MKSQEEFQSKTCLITGAASGIGKATAHLLAQQGCQIALIDIDERLLTELKNELDTKAEIYACDVSNESAVSKTLMSIENDFGALHYAFNNAGIGGEFALTEHYPASDWDRVFNVNTKGVFLSMKYEIPLIRKSGGGAIVNCASLLSEVAYANDSAYVASKFAVLGLTKTAAVEYAQSGIRINAVSPGFTRTPMVDKGDEEKLKYLSSLHPIGRLANPKEIAEAVLWLFSEKSSFMIGHNMVVDGGYTSV